MSKKNKETFYTIITFLISVVVSTSFLFVFYNLGYKKGVSDTEITNKEAIENAASSLQAIEESSERPANIIEFTPKEKDEKEEKDENDKTHKESKDSQSTENKHEVFSYIDINNSRLDIKPYSSGEVPRDNNFYQWSLFPTHLLAYGGTKGSMEIQKLSVGEKLSVNGKEYVVTNIDRFNSREAAGDAMSYLVSKNADLSIQTNVSSIANEVIIYVLKAK